LKILIVLTDNPIQTFLVDYQCGDKIGTMVLEHEECYDDIVGHVAVILFFPLMSPIAELIYMIVDLAVDMFSCVFLTSVLSVSVFVLHHGGYRYEIHLLSLRKGVLFVLSFFHFVEEDFQHSFHGLTSEKVGKSEAKVSR